ncbi:MAG: HEAT repeat domain-containing protein [Pirellulaceae bacterium]|nr:HEAT repeat domain-containing protein [Pirellulaceae bacterium]
MLIIGLVVGIPFCLLLVCGVGGYLIVSQAKSRVMAAADKAKAENDRAQLDPNNPFAALDSPDVRKQMEEGFEKAFDKLDEEMKKQPANQNRGKTRTPRSNNSGTSSGLPGGDSFPAIPNFPRAGEQEKDDFPTNLQRLQTGNDDEKRRAAEWFSRASLQTDKQDEVAKALNNMHTDSLRKHALGALKVWGTKENVPMIARIMQQEAFVKMDCLEMLEKFKDERAIEPLITMLNEAFDEGTRAEQILADWWPQAEQPLIKHLHDKENRIRERTQRILELKKTDQGLLIAQTLEDVKSANREVRQSAVTWLAKQEVQTDLQSKIADAAKELLTDSNGDTRRNAVTMFAKYAQKEHADELLKLLDEREHDKWKAGLTGLIRLGDVRVAERIGRRKELQGDAIRLFREAGAPAQDLVAKTLTQVEVKDWGTGKQLCEVLGDIGTSKSVGFLLQVKKKAMAAKTPFVGEAAEKAIEDIRRRN